MMSHPLGSATARAVRRALFGVLVFPCVGFAQRGSIAVHITDKATGAAIAQAQISVIGTTLGGLTNNDGRVTVVGVPLGAQDVRIARIGYAEQKRTLTMVAGTPVALEVQLASVAFTLTPVVSTATGQTRRDEIGNSIATINAADVVAKAPVSNISDLLNSRAPGVSAAP